MTYCLCQTNYILPTSTTCVSQLLTSHPFTPTYHTMTLLEPSSIMSCKLLNLPNFYRDYLLNLNKNLTVLLLVIPPISYQGGAMDSYHSRQIVELALSLSEFSLFNNTNCPTKQHFSLGKTLVKPVLPSYVYVQGKKLLQGEDLKEVWLGLKLFDSDPV